MSFYFGGRSWYGFILQDVIFLVKFIIYMYLLLLFLSVICVQKNLVYHTATCCYHFFPRYCFLLQATWSDNSVQTEGSVIALSSFLGFLSMSGAVSSFFFPFSVPHTSHSYSLSFLTIKREIHEHLLNTVKFYPLAKQYLFLESSVRLFLHIYIAFSYISVC